MLGRERTVKGPGVGNCSGAQTSPKGRNADIKCEHGWTSQGIYKDCCHYEVADPSHV